MKGKVFGDTRFKIINANDNIVVAIKDTLYTFYILTGKDKKLKYKFKTVNVDVDRLGDVSYTDILPFLVKTDLEADDELRYYDFDIKYLRDVFKNLFGE